MTKRMYGLFEKQGGTWVRIYPTLAYHKEQAVRIFQTQLLAPYLVCGIEFKGMRKLRVVRES